MAYNTHLAERIRAAVKRQPGITEKQMFGGIGFLLHGNLLVGVWKESLIVRLGPEVGTAALSEPHVGPMDITGKPMKGWVMVAPAGLDKDCDLQTWIRLALSFVKGLGPKSALKNARLPKSETRKQT